MIEGRRNGGEMIFNACGSREACPSRQTANARSLRPPKYQHAVFQNAEESKNGVRRFRPAFSCPDAP